MATLICTGEATHSELQGKEEAEHQNKPPQKVSLRFFWPKKL